MPARLVSDYVGEKGEIRSLHRDDVARASRSLSSWYTYDLMGLWTGDKDIGLVEKAAGDDGKRPYMMALITFDLDERRELK